MPGKQGSVQFVLKGIQAPLALSGFVFDGSTSASSPIAQCLASNSRTEIEGSSSHEVCTVGAAAARHLGKQVGMPVN